ncbi:MAG: phenylalanine--tRNA ligase subunit alpha [candidate division Zixibacteria bacterium RBG_16_53_22]|nr:MAG: phenylalanine--tRNA ligase subunit alpha [candidate division Zixibacteria bacterium RBG_16_53_22]
MNSIEREALSAIEKAADKNSLENASNAFLGRKGRLAELSRQLGTLDNESRPKAGARLNEIRKRLSDLAETRALQLAGSEKTFSGIDHTLPGRRSFVGRRHPLLQTVDLIVSIFRGMGFAVAAGPDIETDFYNFDALNTPEDHPSRDLSDTFYVEKGILLRTHTSPVQIRTMQSQKPPVRIIAPGRCYRSDAPDASHSPVFYQCEGLYVDERVTFGDLKGVIISFARELFGPDMNVRFRPHFFPFTEPSAEYDFSCVLCGGKGCRVCKYSGWLEISGAGMVDPEVFKAVGYDPEKYTGYAFGMGVDRITMLRFSIGDIRLLYDNDVRFLRQF